MIFAKYLDCSKKNAFLALAMRIKMSVMSTEEENESEYYQDTLKSKKAMKCWMFRVPNIRQEDLRLNGVHQRMRKLSFRLAEF